MINRIKKIYKILFCFFKYYYYSIYCFVNRINNNDVWLLSERGQEARDNGYHFYKYIKNNNKKINIKYVISKDSPDIKKIDKEDIVYYGSKKHYILFKTSGMLISTHIMGYSPDSSLFWRMDKINLLKLKGKKIFLQHGIIQNHMQSLNKNITKLDLFIAGAKKEYDYLLNNYGYDDKVIKYTGLARYDKLVNNEKNQILIMPTFRKWLNYTNDFKKTEFFKKWNSLLNNEDLIKFLDDNNLKLYFYPHYEIQKKYISYFNSKSKNIIIASINDYDVQQLLIESKLLITDYSSVFFDFAYMKKPIIYYQFDIDEFRKYHYSKGYFDYEKDGFGPVVKEENELLKKIVTKQRVYNKNVNDFFEYRDQNNCERIYKEIIKLEKECDYNAK